MRASSFWAVGSGLALLLVVGGLFLWVEKPPASDSDGMTVAEGFEVQVVAGPPLVERPMIIDSDELGRLYVAESSGSNAPVEQQLAERPHSILRLVDSDGDGRYDERTVFADKMMFPEGVLWHEGSLYVAAPPSIWKLTDTDGDGVADEREEWYDGETLTGCANDLHGPYLGRDGWIYWCKGAFAEQTLARPGGEPFVTRAAHVYRRRPEGGVVEPVLTGGMDNPVEVAFSPEGERFLTATFVEHPQLGRRDGLLHAIYGGVYGKLHNVTDGHPLTGGFLSPMVQLGPAVPVGLTYYESPVFGAEFQRNLFVTLFNLHKVVRFELSPAGASFQAKESDFFTAGTPDFHPTDVMEDADGSLLVVDTGAWFKLCCPTSQLAKPDVLGAIYRIRRTGAAPLEDPRGLGLDWGAYPPDYLVSLLADARPAVRERAIADLAKMGDSALAALREGLSDAGSVERRRNAVWALTRIRDTGARELVREAFSDPQESVRQAAAHSVSVWRDRQAVGSLLEQLASGGPALARAAAEALGRLDDSSAVAPILKATGAAGDPILLHSLTYALIEIGDPGATRAGLEAASPRTRRAAMIALDQMPGGRISPDTVIPLLSSSEPLLQETATWIAGRHPEWGGALSGFFARGLEDSNLRGEERAAVERQLVPFASDAAIQRLLAETVRRGRSKQARLSALRVMSKASLKEVPETWIPALVSALGDADPEVLREAVATTPALPLAEEGNPPLQAALARLGRNEAAPVQIRLDALAAGASALGEVEPALFSFLLAQLDSTNPVRVRGAASRALGSAPVDTGQRLELADALSEAGPIELPNLLGAFEDGGDEALGTRMLAGLGKARGLSNLRADVLEGVLREFPESIQGQGEELLASLGEDRAKQRAHLEELVAALEPGDPRRGQQVFNSSKSACSSCHQIGYLGGRVGPDLTKVGQVRQERDVLESIVYPSASFVRSYEPVVVVTANDTINGVPMEETEESILLATGVNMEQRISRDSIVEMRPGTVSIMPSGLEGELSRQDLWDLVAFLMETHRRND